MSKNKILIFVESDNCIAKFSTIMPNFGQDIVVAVIGPGVTNESIPEDLKGIVTFRVFEEYKDLRHNCKNYAEDALQLIKKIGASPVEGQKTFEDLSTYKDVHLWQIHDNAILSYYLSDFIYYLKVVNAIFEKEQPTQAIVIGSKYNIVSRIFSSIARQRTIPLRWISTHKLIPIALPILPTVLERSFFLGHFEFRIYLPLQPYIAVLFLKTLTMYFWAKVCNIRVKKDFPGKFRKILFYSTNRKQLDSVIPLLRELAADSRNRTLVIHWFRRVTDAVKLLKKENIPYKLFDGYMNWRIAWSLFTSSQIFLRNWRAIEKDVAFQDSCSWDGIHLWNLISDYLRELFLRHFVKMSAFFEVAKRVADSERPDVIVVTNEREYPARLSVIAGRSKAISSLELQRGAIADFADRNAPLYTDKMLVDGQFAKEILMKRGMPSHKLIVAGNPRYDSIKDMDIPCITERIYRDLDLDVTKKLIVFTSTFVNPCHTLVDKRKLLGIVFSGVKKFLDCHLVVKLHPAERNEWLQHKIAEEIGIQNISIVKDVNTFELIAACKVLVTAYSTTGIEAILMDKPLITVNASNSQPDLIPYAESGAALGVYGQADFELALKKTLEDQATQIRLKEARQKFISYHCFALDGKATARAASLINDMIEKESSS